MADTLRKSSSSHGNRLDSKENIRQKLWHLDFPEGNHLGDGHADKLFRPLEVECIFPSRAPHSRADYRQLSTRGWWFLPRSSRPTNSPLERTPKSRISTHLTASNTTPRTSGNAGRRSVRVPNQLPQQRQLISTKMRSRS